MIHTNKHHARYDFAMEVLCSLPKLPIGVSVDALGKDFGFVDSTIKRAICQLQERGYLVAANAKGRMGVEIDGWIEAQVDAEWYLATVYGEGEV